MRRPKLLAAIAAAGIAGALVLIPIVPASAAPALPAALDPTAGIFRAKNLLDYQLTVRSVDLYSTNTPAAQAAWNSQLGKTAALQANAYQAHQVYGNLGHWQQAQPIVPQNQGLNSPGSTIRGAGGFGGAPRPAFYNKPLCASSACQATLGGVGGTAALIGFGMRGEIANGVLSLVGIDANGEVCGVDYGREILSLISGQDCAMYDFDHTYTANAGIDSDAIQSGGCFGAGAPYATLPGNVAINGAQPTCSAAYVVWRNVVGAGTATQTEVVSSVRVTAVTRTSTTAMSVTYETSPWSADGGSTRVPSVYARCMNSAGSAYVTGQSVQLRMSEVPGAHTDTLALPAQCSNGVALFMDSAVTTSASGMPYGMLWRTGSALAPSTVTGGDPLRTLVCTVTYTDNTSSSASTPEFRESQGFLPEPNCPTTPAGKTEKRMKVVQTGGGIERVLYDEETTDAYKDWMQNYSTSCAAQACVLDLIDKSTGVSCFLEADTCADWLKDPSVDSKYQCQYAGQNVEKAQCYVYATTFSTQKRLAGEGYADPKTGEEVGPTSLSVDQFMFGSNVQNPQNMRSCFGGTYAAFNPLEWVFKPIQCGLQWAFVPRAPVVESYVETMTETWGLTPMGEVGALMTGFQPTATVTGCGVPIDVPALGYSGNFGNACSGSLAEFSEYSRIFTSALILIGGATAMFKFASWGLNFKGPTE